MRFKKRDLIDLLQDRPPGELEKVDEDSWQIDGAFQRKNIVFRYGEKFYRIDFTRSGSCHDNWRHHHHYWNDEQEVVEVAAREKTVIVWEEVE